MDKIFFLDGRRSRLEIYEIRINLNELKYGRDVDST